MSWLRVAARSHVGCVRAVNEDVWRFSALRDELCFDLVVCDGMGGMGNGDEAAAVGASSLLQSLQAARPGEADRAAMRRALVHADVTVRETLCTNERFPGCAAVVARVRPEVATIGWVGDCRAYLIRARAVIARTRDHRYTEDLVSAGELTPEQARNHPGVQRAHAGDRRAPGRRAAHVADRGAMVALAVRPAHVVLGRPVGPRRRPRDRRYRRLAVDDLGAGSARGPRALARRARQHDRARRPLGPRV